MAAVLALLLAGACVPAAAAPIEIDWVRIPGGVFDMGSKPGSRTDRKTGKVWYPDLLETERPVHRVAVKTFELARAPVTFRQYRACIAAGACAPTTCDDGRFMGDDQPVVCVDWHQAKAFSEWVGGRLPSEAEWEYAARSAGKDREYPWGDEQAACERAVMSDDDAGGIACGRGVNWPVCSKPKGNTEQGLCDMAGLVWQWTQDWYHDSYDGAPLDGSAWEIPAGFDRVTRGGSYDNHFMMLRSANRGAVNPNFRCASSERGLRNMRAFFLYLGLMTPPRGGRSIGFRPARSVAATSSR